MPDTDGQQASTETDPLVEDPGGESASAIPPPPPETPREVIELRAQLQGMQESMAMLRDGFNALAANRLAANPTQDPGIPDLTDEQIETAFAEGKGAIAMRQVIRAQVERAKQDLQRNSIDPLAQQVNVTGIGALSAHAFEIVKPQLKYYDRYKGEIDTALGTMAPELKLDPRNIKHLHDLVAGRHLDELLAEEREKAIRQFRENPASIPGTAAARQAGNKKNVPTVEEIMGREAAAAAESKGGPDAFAQRLGYGDWEDYLKKTGTVEGNA